MDYIVSYLDCPSKNNKAYNVFDLRFLHCQRFVLEDGLLYAFGDNDVEIGIFNVNCIKAIFFKGEV